MAYDHGAFRVKNLEEAIRFYTEKLGFTVLFQVGSEEFGERGVFLEYNGARLELIEKIGVPYEPVRPEPPYCPHLCFETDDMESGYCRRITLKFLTGPMRYRIPSSGSILWTRI